jgi:putative aldouronate transport system substrate-binding protein
MIVPIDAYDIRTNMPNYYSRLQMNESDKPMYSSDGHLYYVGYLEAQNVNHIGNHYINKTWLDRLGLQVPTTVDQLTTVLTAFRDRAPGGTGTLPMSAGGDEGFFTDRTQGLGPHFAMWGVPFHEDKGIGTGSYAAINAQGRVQFVTDYPGFRPALEWFAMAYRDRLLDMESLTRDWSGGAVKVSAGRVGFFSYLRLINSALTAETAANYVSIIPPAATGYRVAVPRLMEVAEQTRGATISSTNRYIAQTMQWLDKQLETERMMVGLYGNVTTSAGALTPPPLSRAADGKYEVAYTPDNNGLYSIVPVWHGMFFAPGDYIFANYNMAPHRVERFNTSQAYAQAGVLEPGSFTILRSLIKPNSADATEMSRLAAEINRLMQESLARFVRDGVTTANWNTFTGQLNSVGVPRYVQLLQKYYDVYAASVK